MRNGYQKHLTRTWAQNERAHLDTMGVIRNQMCPVNIHSFSTFCPKTPHQATCSLDYNRGQTTTSLQHHAWLPEGRSCVCLSLIFRLQSASHSKSMAVQQKWFFWGERNKRGLLTRGWSIPLKKQTGLWSGRWAHDRTAPHPRHCLFLWTTECVSLCLWGFSVQVLNE